MKYAEFGTDRIQFRKTRIALNMNDSELVQNINAGTLRLQPVIQAAEASLYTADARGDPETGHFEMEFQYKCCTSTRACTLYCTCPLLHEIISDSPQR